jgi:hypothetical protein
MKVLKLDTSTYLGFNKICNVDKYVQVGSRTLIISTGLLEYEKFIFSFSKWGQMHNNDVCKWLFL